MKYTILIIAGLMFLSQSCLVTKKRYDTAVMNGKKIS